MDFGDDGGNVKRLPVKFKKPGPEDRSVVLPYEVGVRKCKHFNAQFVVDETLMTVECSLCKEQLNPMWVLSQIAKYDRRLHEAHDRYQEEMKRLKKRTRTKCRHCGEMTKISRSG